VTEAQEKALLEGTIKDLREALSALRQRRNDIDAQMREKQERLDLWEAKLKKLGAANSVGRKRQTKGENRRLIVDLLRREPAGLSFAEITERTNVAPSSARVIIRDRHKDEFVEEAGRIRLRGQAEGDV
jgi:chromosome segregation ATPase